MPIILHTIVHHYFLPTGISFPYSPARCLCVLPE